jgi:putative peptidoglycan lipid II flippase
MYRRRLGFPTREVTRHLGRVVPLAVAAGLLAWVISLVLPRPGYIVPGALGLAVAGGAGLALYLLGAALLRMPEMAGVTRRLRR